MKRLLFFVLFTTIFYDCSCTDSTITNAKAITVYDENDAWMIDTDNNLYKYDTTTNKFQLYAVGTPVMVQIASRKDGSNMVGTDNTGVAKLWNGAYGTSSSWSSPRGTGKRYDWVLIDPVSQVTRGLRRGLGGAWEAWDTPSGGSWDTYLPVGIKGSTKMKDLFFVDTDFEAYTRWERGDADYLARLNFSGQGSPFYIYYYGDDSDAALTRIINPPVATKNIDDVEVKQISYDADYQNLWCVDTSGTPWQWDNVGQEWIARNIKGDEGYVPPETPESQTASLLQTEDNFYVRVVYVDGVYKPKLIVFKSTYLMLLLLGDDTGAELANQVDVIIFEETRNKTHNFHNIELKPKETPQKIVRIDGGKKIRENYYLERLLLKNNIITDADKLGVYPSEHRIIRR